MDFGIRELLMFIGALIFMGVLIDGVRRFKENRRKQIKLEVSRNSKALEEEEDEEDDWYSAELPNGKARVKHAQYADEEETKITPRFSEPVDILMEESHFVGMGAKADSVKNKSYSSTDHEDVNNNTDDNESKEVISGQEFTRQKSAYASVKENIPPKNFVEQENFADDDEIDDGIIGTPRIRVQSQEVQESQSKRTETPQRNTQGFYSDNEQEHTSKISAKKPAINQGDLFVAGHEEMEEAHSAPEHDLPEEVLSVNVIAKKGQEIDGQVLLDAVRSFGLRFGDMDIFHRHEHASGQGPVIFSMANALNPGTFDMETLAESHIKGVTFFMRLSTVNKRIFVLELMVDIAKRLSNQLGAELKDDTHSVLSSQTVTHYKSRIQEYERRYLGQVLRK